jgi:hypothetical protein
MAKTRTLPVDHPGSGIGRRQVIRGLLTGAGAGVALPGLAQDHPLVEHAHHPERLEAAREGAGDASREPEFLDDYSFALLDSLGERIVPGAATTGCAAFIDGLLAVGTREDGRRFLLALGAIDTLARERFGAPWPDLTDPQQSEVLEVASTAPPAHERGAGGAASADRYLDGVRGGPAPATRRDHFEYLKAWLLGAYYTSEEGLRELGYEGPVFAESFPGCPHPDGHR